tara:strand:+ start:136 stop:597 length:462 start_codon:yes stop_codon:yes gene_type:complete
MGDDTLYNYELKKTLMPGFLTKGIRIKDSWVSRCRRYLTGGEPNLSALISFINKGMVDRRRNGFNEKALDGSLSIAQKWLLLHLVLKDGVPEYLRNEEEDEDAPELIEAEPVQDSVMKTAVNTAMKPVTSLGNMVSGKKTDPVEQEETEKTQE